jgi:ferrous iron transport protein B
MDRLDAERAELALRASLAGRLGVALEDVTSLAGFDWRTNIALVGGVAAKEVIVSTLGTAYSWATWTPRTPRPCRTPGRGPRLDPAQGAALMLFILLYAPCFVTWSPSAARPALEMGRLQLVFNTAWPSPWPWPSTRAEEPWAWGRKPPF